jgi:hypothetical protein
MFRHCVVQLVAILFEDDTGIVERRRGCAIAWNSYGTVYELILLDRRTLV